MRRIITVIILAIGLLAAPASATLRDTANYWDARRPIPYQTRQWLYQYQIDQRSNIAFIEMADQWWVKNQSDWYRAGAGGPYQNLNWTTDGCSAGPDRLYYFDFRAACRVHDFAYRNWKDLEYYRRTLFPQYGESWKNQWTETKRNQVDSVFRDNMHLQCEHEPWNERGMCHDEAEIYYFFARQVGSYLPYDLVDGHKRGIR